MNQKKFLHHEGFVIQWHITERCNWRCGHCYQGGFEGEDLPFDDLKGIVKNCLELFKALHINPHHARINIGGGEPFLRKDFFKLLHLLNSQKDHLAVQIMTNGSLLNSEIARDLKKITAVRGVQVSMEGLKENNDKIRGKNAFDKVIRAIEILKNNKIYTRVSLTLTRQNSHDIKDLILLLRGMGVNSVGIRRHVPIGRGAQLKKEMLSPGELHEFYREKFMLKRRLDRPPGFFITNGCEDAISSPSFNNCGVVRGHHLNIYANGDILACRRLPIVVGNALKENLLDVYFASDTLWNLRNINNAHPLCKRCSLFQRCLGGAKCVIYAYFKNPFMPDPQCWRLFKHLPKSATYQNSAKNRISCCRRIIQ